MKHYEWIDIVKGIGIVLVIFGHSQIPNILSIIIFTFHIPLFFFIGGFLFNYYKYKIDTKLFIKNKANRLIFPYFITNIIMLFTYFLLSFRFKLDISPIKNLIGIFYGNGAPLNPPTQFTNTINIPSWFLLSLFCGYILLFILAYYHEKYGLYLSLLLCLFFIILGFNISKYIYLPWGLDIAFVSMIFMFLGYLVNYYISIQKILKKDYISLLSILTLSIVITINGKVDMNLRDYNNLLLFAMGGMLGTYLTIKLSKKINTNENIVSRLFIYMGKNSLTMYLFHPFTPNLFLYLLDVVFHIKIMVINSAILYALNTLLFSLLTVIIIKKTPILKNIYKQ